MNIQKLKNLKIDYYKNDIIEIKKVLSKEQCKFIIDTVEKENEWENATTLGNIDNYRLTKMYPITSKYGKNSDLYLAHSILGYVFKVCFELVEKLYPISDMENKFHLSYNGDQGFQILKYEQNNFYKEHIDNGPNLNRSITTLFYLNEDFKGGETYFPRQDVFIKPEEGKVVFFPSCYTHPHKALEVKDGVKYNAVLWSF